MEQIKESVDGNVTAEDSLLSLKSVSNLSPVILLQVSPFGFRTQVKLMLVLGYLVAC